MGKYIFNNEKVVFVNLNTEAIMFVKESSKYLGLNQSSADILNLIIQGKSQIEIHEFLIKKYNVENTILELQLQNTLEWLINEEYIHIENS